MKSLTQTARPGKPLHRNREIEGCGDRFLRDGSIPVARRFVRDLEMVSDLGDPQVLPPDQDRINQHLLT